MSQTHTQKRQTRASNIALQPAGKRSTLALVRNQKGILAPDSFPKWNPSIGLLDEIVKARKEVPESLSLQYVTEVVKREESSLRPLLENARMIMWEADPQTLQFTYVSDLAEKILGYPIAEWYVPGFLLLHLHPDDQRLLSTCRERLLWVDESADLTFRVFNQEGRIVWLHSRFNVTYGVYPKRLAGFMIDVSEQKRAEEAMSDLGGRLIAAQEKERSRIARELHDDFNQRMALLSIELEQLGQQIAEPFNHQLFEKLQSQVKEISADIHKLSYTLHPSKLDHLGLASAVKSLCEEMSMTSKVKVSFYKNSFPSNIPTDVALTLFRVAQEALRNCVRHSGAESIEVVLVKVKDSICLSISDDGCGFDPKSSGLKSGLGFISMHERLNLVGGEMNVTSKPNQGTRIEVSVPIAHEC